MAYKPGYPKRCTDCTAVLNSPYAVRQHVCPPKRDTLKHAAPADVVKTMTTQ